MKFYINTNRKKKENATNNQTEQIKYSYFTNENCNEDF